jgi:hypothetical protein
MRYLLLAVLIISAAAAQAQFRVPPQGETSVPDGLIRETPASLLLGWFDPDRFQMRHSFSLSYMTAGDQGLSLGMYTNSMMYQFADNLNARADVSFSYSPTSSFSRFSSQDLSGVFLSRAQVDYRPWENMHLQVQYRRDPYRTYSPWDTPWSSPWYREDGF